MFWRFGLYHSLDSLLDKEDVSLEEILDEDELLQECKEQNSRLIDYFQRVDVLQRLLGYVTGQIECEEKGRFKYPYVATEVLCSEIWSIVETCLNNSDQLLVPFWETVLDRPPEEMKTQMVMASHFAKINAVFLNKKPVEMLAFIQSQPHIVARLLRHIEAPSFVDLLVRIIQLDEHPACGGVLEWLSEENLMGRLVDLMSPLHTPDIHTVVSELIKGIISMAAPSPGAGLTEGLQNGPASNLFARQLAHASSISKLTDYILSDFGSKGGEDSKLANALQSTSSSSLSKSEDSEVPSIDDDEVLPNKESHTSSVVQSISIIIELIRKNNSDYFEPYLFHTLRNRLITLQQQLPANPDESREMLERAMREMVDRMGVVHLGSVLEITCNRLDEYQMYLDSPRSLEGPMLLTVGTIAPLTFERYRICELYAELLHCSNMSLLNRPPEYNHIYDAEGRLQGGLPALEELARVIAMSNGDDGDGDAMDEEKEELEPAQELPISNASHESSSVLDSDEEMDDDSDNDAMEEIAMSDEPPFAVSPPPTAPLSASPSTTAPASTEPQLVSAPPRKNSLTLTADSDSTSRPRSSSSRRSLKRSATLDSQPAPPQPLPIGERLKQQFLEKNVLSKMLDLFFGFPLNNFLHSVVYDFLHQILTGRVDEGMNRELTISLFRDVRIMDRILEGQRRNDVEVAKPKGVRLGYMGHLTLISEDVIGALEHYPPDLRAVIRSFAPQPAWDEYVSGRYIETKKNDTSLLGGGKPVVGPGAPRAGPGARWKVDEAEGATTQVEATETADAGVGGSESDVKEEPLRKPSGSRREGSDDFGTAFMDEDEDDHGAAPPQFARYLAQEMQSSNHFGSASSSDGSDEEEDEGGWLAQSTFSLGAPPSGRHDENNRTPLDRNGFEDAFTPQGGYDDPFTEEDDAFGPFSDTAAASGADPFTFASSFSEEIEHASFEDFGDFGDFQAATEGDGELTPTAGSWSFTSNSSASSEPGVLEDGAGGDSSKERAERKAFEEPRTALTNDQQTLKSS
ncbi:SAPS-domain-containing protein [Gloeophyllum trabeum ATCC 11539]|uniref:SAPS-domain-containing protein n=1 Tax=Gloeophyllum trabeum (strain ATCC 11539 / FP-39264 / Madison 617) TaxID=670483 RepID=S7RWN6_GLOTA|nr:SAPS-domain-containing protein [Gloeophyllum trabeum ATCC 11539]EPQ57764.1 SAPS-domain-containing protein [Gloeophyllum trabeum ATCC 11539]